MLRNRFGFLSRGAAAAALLASVTLTGGCSLGTSPDDRPTSAEIVIGGTTPNPLLLIVSTDFFEQLNTSTGVYTTILNTSDTVAFTPPYDRSVDMSASGSIYVELYQPELETASVNMRVDLNNGERFERSATMADGAQLIYYFVFSSFGL